jgi:hypothetical protein
MKWILKLYWPISVVYGIDEYTLIKQMYEKYVHFYYTFLVKEKKKAGLCRATI